MKFSNFELSLLLKIKKMVEEKNFKYFRISKKHITYRDTNGEKYFFENNKFVSVESDNESALGINEKNVDDSVLDDIARLDEENDKEYMEDQDPIMSENADIVLVNDDNESNESSLGINEKNVDDSVLDDIARLDKENDKENMEVEDQIMSENADIAVLVDDDNESIHSSLETNEKNVDDSVFNDIARLDVEENDKEYMEDQDPIMSENADVVLVDDDSLGINDDVTDLNDFSRLNVKDIVNEYMEDEEPIMNENADDIFNLVDTEDLIVKKRASLFSENSIVKKRARLEVVRQNVENFSVPRSFNTYLTQIAKYKNSNLIENASSRVNSNEESTENREIIEVLNSEAFMPTIDFNFFDESSSNNYGNSLIQTNDVSCLVQLNDINNDFIPTNDFNFFEEYG